jgi:class 3 adenylate cyclase
MSNLQITHSSQLLRAIEHEEKLNIELWNQRLPPKIAEAVLSGNKSTINPEIYDDVTIFSSNVIDFDRKTMRSNPVDVVNILNDLHFVMDYCLMKFNLYKLDIIGDVYVCVAGVTSRNNAHENAALIADFALLVKECVKLIKFPKSADAVRLTIGINSGKSTGAVVGNHLPRFCLFGNAINIANFLEISGQNDYINCSSTTAKLLREHGQHVVEEGIGFVAKDKARKTYVIRDITPDNTRLTAEFIRTVKQEAKQALKLSVKNRKSISIQGV